MTLRQIAGWREVVERDRVRKDVHLTESIRMANIEKQKDYNAAMRKLRDLYE